MQYLDALSSKTNPVDTYIFAQVYQTLVLIDFFTIFRLYLRLKKIGKSAIQFFADQLLNPISSRGVHYYVFPRFSDLLTTLQNKLSKNLCNANVFRIAHIVDPVIV